MKRKIITFLAIAQLLATNSIHAENVRTNPARVNKATVFLTGAQLTCTSEFQTIPGINQFVFEGVSPQLDQNSLQASGKGNIIILDVKFETRFNDTVKNENPKRFDKALKLASDSLVMVNFEIEELNEQMQGLVTEKSLLLNNRIIKGETQRDSLPVFKESIEFLRVRLLNINAESSRIKKSLFYKNEMKQLLNERIANLNKVHQNGENPPQEAVYSIVVMAQAETPGAAQVSVTFFVNNAAWLPSYDLRANTNGTIDLNYKAELRQSTGMNWNNVALILSTGNPTQNTQKPALSPFYLSFIHAYREKYKNEDAKDLRKDPRAAAAETGSSLELDEMLAAKSIANFTTVNEGMIQTEYDIKLKYSIPNDDNMHLVVIQNKSLKSSYKYSVVPKLDASAYLIAELEGWGDLDLIPGSSKIYFDGSYVGKSVLNPDATLDTISLSLGKDRSILVSRKKLKDKTKQRVFLDEKILSTTYEITVRNNKSEAILIDVNDQFPVSADKNIKVELIDSDGAAVNAETGGLTWKLNLKGKDSRKIRFSYDVKIPKDKNLAGL